MNARHEEELGWERIGYFWLSPLSLQLPWLRHRRHKNLEDIAAHQRISVQRQQKNHRKMNNKYTEKRARRQLNLKQSFIMNELPTNKTDSSVQSPFLVTFRIQLPQKFPDIIQRQRLQLDHSQVKKKERKMEIEQTKTKEKKPGTKQSARRETTKSKQKQTAGNKTPRKGK